jgi:hypothetical protein
MEDWMHFIVFALAMSLLPSAWGFGVSPCLRKLTFIDGQLDQRRMTGASWFNSCDLILTLDFKSAVHEHMTLASVARFRGGEYLAHPLKRYPSEYMTEKPWVSPFGKRHETRGIIFGVWWNDDPLRLTWGEGNDFLAGSWNAIETAVSKNASYPGAGACKVLADQHLGRQSHFDKLQHLHFMTPMESKTSNAKQRVETTTKLALGWMKFAYNVAIGKYAPDARLTDFMMPDASLPSVADIAKNNCASESSAKVWTIFTQRDPTWDKLREPLTPDIALGSMLHVIQDSFSPGHTCRIKKVMGNRTYSVIVDVENYMEQKNSSHRGLDGYPDWLKLRVQNDANDNKFKTDPRLYANDPVVVGDWLMEAADRKSPWEKVEGHLLQTIFLAEPTDDITDCIGGRAKRQ